MSTIHVDESALTSLREALESAGQEYKTNLARLTNLMEQITSGDIQGEPANDLLSKYQSKQDKLNQITATIEEAEEYLGLQTKKFGNLISDLKSGMR